MTEVEVRETAELAPIQPTSLMLWAMDAAEAYKVAVSLCKTSFVPQSLRGKPEEAAAAILTGAEIGLAPMAALRSIDIIQGTPAMRAHAIRGLVQSRGHEVWVEDAGPLRAVVSGRRKGSSVTQTSTWDIERAKGLGLLAKDNWKKQPQAMLVARATSELCRLVASDVLLGLPYSIEELDDSSEHEAPVQVARKVARKPAIHAPEPSLTDEQPHDAPGQEPRAETLTPEPSMDWPAVKQPADE